MTKQGHPLPGSDEARHNEIPEHLEREKGLGDDSKAVVQPQDEAVNPDGEPYRYDDLGRGAGSEEADTEDQMADNSSKASSGRQAGGGPRPSDMEAPGGSSGTGGYGKAQNQMFHQGQHDQSTQRADDEDQSRGERFDEAQGGGRGADIGNGSSEFASDQAQHQDRGQSETEKESEES